MMKVNPCIEDPIGMNIVACMKQVPDTTHVQIDPETNTLIRETNQGVMNPLDLFALEEALRIRDKVGGTVTALTLGPPQAAAILREAMAYGAERGVLITGREFAGSDTWSTSYALARAIEELGPFELVLCGKQAVDGDTAHVGPELAAHLRAPQATFVRRIRDLSAQRIVVERITDIGYTVLELPLPAVVTVVKELNEPRLPNLADLIRGRRASIPELGAREIKTERSKVGLDSSPTRVKSIFSPDTERSGQIYSNDVGAGISAVVEFLERERRPREAAHE